MRDLRLSYFETYANYYFLNIRSFIGKNGDCYDRYLIRMREMVESLNIISQVVNNLTHKALTHKNTKLNKNDYFFSYLDYIAVNNLRSNKKFKQSTWYIGMEELINHFKYYSNGIQTKKGISYCSIEAPKGEFGVTLVSDGSNKPYRCKIKGSSYYHLQALDTMIQGHFFSDLVTIIGSQDLVMGEVDR